MSNVIYLRTDSTGWLQNIALFAQAVYCIRYCAQMGYFIHGIVIDAGQSGPSLERPGLIRIRKLVATKRVDMVVVSTRDRFTQDSDHWRLLKEEFFRTGAWLSVATISTRWL